MQTLDGVLLLFSFYVLFRTFKSNSYLSPVVRVERDRQHPTVSSGPYQDVRHPMYSAIRNFVIGTSLLLASGYGAL